MQLPRPVTSTAKSRLLDRATNRFNAQMNRLDESYRVGRIQPDEASAGVSAAATDLERSLQQHLRPDDPHASQLGKRVREQTTDWFMRSRFHARAYSKPRGYGGDYYTIELLYNGAAGGEGWVGPLLDQWILERPAAQAVRNRRVLLGEQLLTQVRKQGVRPMAVTSLGSGPARELMDILVDPAALQVRATCIDIDDEALTYATSLARAAGIDGRITFALDNVIQLARGSGRTNVDAQNVIYSVGLFDYLPDRLAVAVMNWAYSHLAPGGVLLVGNVHPSNPTRAYMDHLLDWKLIHRSPEQLRALFACSQFGTRPVQVAAESAGVQLFALCERP